MAVVGQPNVGKSTLFNVLTGRAERVGNFPGTTVAASVGRLRRGGRTLCLVDLPGVYDLGAASTADERAARDYVLFGDWDAVLVLVDLTGGPEGLYLAAQVLQLTDRAVVALTKWDEVSRRGLRVDLDGLRGALGVPVVPTSALRGEGLEELLEAVESVAWRPAAPPRGLRVDYGPLEGALDRLAGELAGRLGGGRVDPRGLAVLIARGGLDVAERLGLRGAAEALAEAARSLGADVGDYVAERTYGFVRDRLAGLVAAGRPEGPGGSLAYRVFGNPLAGVAATAVILFSAVFAAFAVNTGFPFTALLEALGRGDLAEALESYTISGLVMRAFGYLQAWVRGALGPSNPALSGLLADGVIEGVGVVSSFAPLILVTMMIMSAIEDSGLGPLMAASVHRLFARFGLSGRAVYPLFISLGCNVPGVMASRAALDDAERLEIVASAPFIPCQARLVVLLAMAGFLLPGRPALQALVVAGVYLGGALLYLLTAWFFRRVVLGVRSPPELVLELPGLRRPSLRVVWWNSWSLTRHFLVRAGTVLVVITAAVWALTSYGPAGPAGSPSQSWAFYVGRLVGYAVGPLYGLGGDSSWKVGFALLMGFMAKENLLATMAVMVGAEGYRSALQALGLTAAQGVAVLVLFMYYVPCAATVSAIYAESRSARFTALVVAYVVAVALLASLLVYGAASLLRR